MRLQRCAGWFGILVTLAACPSAGIAGASSGQGESTFDAVHRVSARQSDGRHIVGLVASGSDADFILRRYAADGVTIDPSFSGGTRTVAFDLGETDIDSVRSVVVLPDDRIMVAGIVATPFGPAAGLVRLSRDGDLDMSFGFRGRSVLPGGDRIVTDVALAVDDAGRSVVVMTLSDGLRKELSTIRLRADGELDESWTACANAGDAAGSQPPA